MSLLDHSTAPLPRDEEQRLLAQAKPHYEPGATPEERASVREAEDLLVRANLRFVAKIAGDFRRGHPGRCIDDLTHVGAMGLLHAIRNFDPRYSHTVRLVTYARPKIYQAIRRWLDDTGADHPIAVPAYLAQRHRVADKGRRDMASTFGREVSLSEYCDRSGLRGFAERLDKVDRVSRVQYRDCLPELPSDSPSPIEAFEARDIIAQALDCLPESQRSLVESVMGFHATSGKRTTLVAIAKQRGITRQRVDQIYASAIQRMREYVTSHGLSACS